MSRTQRQMRQQPTRAAPRVGLFGLLGSGNIGNDGSMAAVLAFLEAEHPDVVVDAMCAGPERVAARCGIPATRLHWYRAEYQTASGPIAIAMKGVGKIIDAYRTAAWVRRHDVVIVPGMGVLEATVPLRPWGFPYALFALCASGRLLRTKVALVSVGANVMPQRLTRWLVVASARLAHYRSYRDDYSKDAMSRMGVDTSRAQVYPDLAFALAAPPAIASAGRSVGVGVMAYYGGGEDRTAAAEIHRRYVDTMTRFVRWLLDGGRRVRLFTGDTADTTVVSRILTGVRADRPELDSCLLTEEQAGTFQDLLRQMSAVDTVVATRYHNVVCALRLGKPTLSIGYAAKNDVLMAHHGLGEFCQSAREIDLDRLIDQFSTLERRSGALAGVIAERVETDLHRLDDQFAALTTTLLPAYGRSIVAREAR